MQSTLTEPKNSRQKNPVGTLFSTILALFLLCSLQANAQNVNDYRSKATGDWTALTTWERWNGASWVEPTVGEGYPGQNGITGLVTILAPHTITVNTNIVGPNPTTQRNITKLDLYGKITRTINGTSDINVLEMELFPPSGQILFQSAQAAFRIPLNSSIFFPVQNPAYEGFSKTGNCNNNTAIYIGGGSFGGTELKYAACTGGGNVCVTFDGANAAGGTIRVVPEIDISSSLGVGNISCVPSFTGFINILGVLQGSIVNLTLSGTNITYNPAQFSNLTDGGANDLSPAGDGVIRIQTDVTTPAINDGMVKTYTAIASAELFFNVAQNDPCFSFRASTQSSANFFVRPPGGVTITPPASTICAGDVASISLQNGTELIQNVFYRFSDGVNPTSSTSIAVPASSSVSINIPAGSPATYTYTFDSTKFSTPPPCKVTYNNNVVAVSRGDVSGLVVDGDTKTGHSVTLTDRVTSSTGCRIFASVGTTDVTTVDARAWVTNDPYVYLGRPYVGRRILLTPTATNGTNAATIKLYATQQEFTNFNNSPINHVDLPQSSGDPQGFAANLRIYKFNTGTFDAMTGVPTVADQAAYDAALGSNSIQIITPTSVTWQPALYGGVWEMTFNVSGFSLFLISNFRANILPLDLLSFDAQLSGKRNANLIWKTSDEKDVNGFEVQVSRDGSQFTTVGLVNARNTLAGGEYNYTTNMPGKLGYFRLKIVEKNGSFTYSPVKTLRTDEAIISSYPNPVRDQLIVDLSGYPAGTLRVLDMSGRALINNRTVDGINRVNTSALTNGVYILEVNVGKESETIKISKLDK